jgi:tetratricopeptide (TPR) repeat protein
LSVSHHKLAEAALAADRPDEAVAEARAAVAISERLASADPSNRARATDLSAVEEMLGNAQLAAGDHAGAAIAYGRALELATANAKTSSGDHAAQRSVGVLDAELADALAPSDPGAARTHRQAALAILEPLADRDPELSTLIADLRTKLH